MEFYSEKLILNNVLKSLKGNKDKVVNLLCCVNDVYVDKMINLMFSIRNFSDKQINLFVLTTEMNQDSENLIKDKMDYLNVNVQIIHASLPSYDTCNAVWSLDVYLKVFAFKFLPENIDKILYLDSDIMAFNDIYDLYCTNVENKLLACVIDMDVNSQSVFHRRRLLKIKHDYFNSGVMVLNLKLQREKWTFEGLNALISSTQLFFPDQDLLNILCREDDLVFVPYKNNFQSWWEIMQDSDLEFISPTLIHFVTMVKPWLPNDFYYTTELFYSCAKLTGLKQFGEVKKLKGLEVSKLQKQIKKEKANKK